MDRFFNVKQRIAIQLVALIGSPEFDKDCGYIVHEGYSKRKWKMNLNDAIKCLDRDPRTSISKVHEGYKYNNDLSSNIPIIDQDTHLFRIVVEHGGYSDGRSNYYVCSKTDVIYEDLINALKNNMNVSAALEHCYTNGYIKFTEIVNELIKIGPDLSSLRTYHDYLLICNDKSEIVCHVAVLAGVPFFDLLFKTGIGNKTENMSKLEVPYNKTVVESAIAFVYGDEQKFNDFSGSMNDLIDLANLLCMWYPNREDVVQFSDLIQPQLEIGAKICIESPN